MRGAEIRRRLALCLMALLLTLLCACAAGKTGGTDYGEYVVRTEREREAPGAEAETEPEPEKTRALPADARTAESEQEDYVLNKNSMKFHYPSCTSVGEISEKNRWTYHGTREDVIELGYQPCKICNP